MIALEAFLATIGIAMILVISLSVIIAGVRSEWPMFLGAFGYHPPRIGQMPPRPDATARSITVSRDAVAPPHTQAVEPACETGSAAA
ncbi:hypothetical protein [Sphingomonas montanisoli]|uniref:Uncharacterized protein n=1 Tax=Sphingomonas montanisoli TaxID=2606412 RepID=A0A5D9C1Z9_9SPHN|nr:hypothetical protein [Sphingomonas montanisoli]TZG25619.1 hypothetical protein FYJ91_11375 [Sphingomonas montanisoli]